MTQIRCRAAIGVDQRLLFDFMCIENDAVKVKGKIVIGELFNFYVGY